MLRNLPIVANILALMDAELRVARHVLNNVARVVSHAVTNVLVVAMIHLHRHMVRRVLVVVAHAP